MEKITKSYKSALKKGDGEKLNDLLIEMGKNAKKESLFFIDDLIKNCPPKILEKIAINLVFVLSEIGNTSILEKKYIDYIIGKYYQSDRWIRSEIITALEKILRKNKIINEDLTNLVANALREEYLPVKIGALKLLSLFEELPNIVVRSALIAIEPKEERFLEEFSKVMKNRIKSNIQLFDLLNSSENYKVLRKKAFRTILLSFYISTTELELFQEKIVNSNWETEYKDNFLREINTLKDILSKSF